VLAFAAAVLLVAGCSSGSSSSDGATTTSTTTAAVERPDGPAAEITELTGGKGINLLAAAPGPDLDAHGWVEHEYAAAGDAVSYTAKGDLPTDGHFDLQPGPSAPYRTRIVVRRPAAEADFNGTVVVEWLNVSGGIDATPDYTYLADEMVREGYAWVGVSAQRIGIEGGPVAVKVAVSELAGAGQGIKAQDPERYGSLEHPGDAFSYDMFTQVARALRTSGADGPMGPLKPTYLLAAGESQSAYMLTTYDDGVQPLTGAFDGFLIHSRGGAAGQLGKPGEGADIAGSIGGKPTKIRTDGEAPIMVVETETDVAGILGYLPARQPDDDRFRLWEIAGTAHVDRDQLGDVADMFECDQPINAGPHHFVVASALAHLNAWVAKGEAPPKADRLAVGDDGKLVLNTDGIATGGIRTPLVDVPVDVLSGVVESAANAACLLAGTTTPIPAERLAALYPSRQAYLDEYAKATDAAIAAGFVLPADREELLSRAQPDRLGG
jgi:hypothetical protein